MGIKIQGVPNPRVSQEYLSTKKPHLPEGRAKLGRARPSEAVPKKQDIGKSLDILREAFRLFNRRLKFSVNEEIDRVVVKVIDGTTDKVIKEIPPEEIQKLIARIKETIGILFDEQI
jgi:flagellar protein FlaG